MSNTPTITRTDENGKVVRRIIVTDQTETTATFITQVPASDGGWWNIHIERKAWRPEGATK